MQNTTEITVKIFDDGKEPVTCARGEINESPRWHCQFFSYGRYICFCDLFSEELMRRDANRLTIPCPECLRAREEAKGEQNIIKRVIKSCWYVWRL